MTSFLVPSTKFSALRGVALTLASLGALATSGCMMSDLSGPTSTPINAVAGIVHGGQTPMQGTTVTLYVTRTTATGYGQAATVIGTSTTDVNGAWSISPSVSTTNCPAGQQAYLTAAGGYPSGASSLLNNTSLMMAALGDCVNLSTSTHVIINEVTTVAAAYALSGFMTTSANGSLFQANVSAPAANSAATGTGVVAAGLPHAFLNAATLASYAYGTANPLTPNVTIGTTVVNGSVPVVEINTLADILQTCVNGGGVNNPICSTLYGYTPSISGVVPTNTLQAMINLARNPYPSVNAMTAASGIFSLTAASPAFLPMLSAQPPDWSIAVVYKSATAGAAPFIADYDIALDANDTAYYGGSAAANLVGMSAYGATVPAFTAASAGTATRQLAPDTHGNIWMSNNAGLLLQYSASAGGAPTTASTITTTGAEIFGIAVDLAGNVWVANAATTTPNVFQYAYPTYTVGITATAPGGFEPVQLTVDDSQNIWMSDYYTSGSLAAVIPNLGSTLVPSYGVNSTTTALPVSATFASSAIKPLGVVIDASGNAWYGITGSNTVTTTGIEEVIPGLSSGIITSLSPQTLVTGAVLGAKASQIPGMDGAGTVYLPDNQGAGAAGIHAYSTVAVSSSDTSSQVLSPPAGYLGCYLATATTTTCATGSSSAVYNPRVIAIDSTGSVWGGVSSGGLTQVIGLAAPSWPLLATGKPGLSPGLTTVTPLP